MVKVKVRDRAETDVRKRHDSNKVERGSVCVCVCVCVFMCVSEIVECVRKILVDGRY